MMGPGWGILDACKTLTVGGDDGNRKGTWIDERQDRAPFTEAVDTIADLTRQLAEAKDKQEKWEEDVEDENTELAERAVKKVKQKLQEEINQIYYSYSIPQLHLQELEKQLSEAREEIARLNKMRVHCDNCGADYMATGIEVGCPCTTNR